jgi:hypothetical protein
MSDIMILGYVGKFMRSHPTFGADDDDRQVVEYRAGVRMGNDKLDLVRTPCSALC